MGFFFNRFNIFSEGGADDEPQEDTAENNEEKPDNDASNPEDNQEDNTANNDDNQEEDDEPVDYTDDEYDSDTNDNSDGDGDSSNNDDEEAVDDLKSKEEELYSDLSVDQLDIKHKELKSQYLSMFDTIVTIIDRIGDAAISEDSIEIIEFISTTLCRLKDMITDYMNSVYKTKSYIENSINYNRFLAVLNAINKILEEMDKKED